MPITHSLTVPKRLSFGGSVTDDDLTLSMKRSAPAAMPPTHAPNAIKKKH
jgi:hypothetical protein